MKIYWKPYNTIYTRKKRKKKWKGREEIFLLNLESCPTEKQHYNCSIFKKLYINIRFLNFSGKEINLTPCGNLISKVSV
jgi:hypothetical protein